MVRKRVILLGLTLGLIVNQFMLWQCNKVISAPNYSYTSADSNYSGYSYNNSQQYRNQNSYYGGGYSVDPKRLEFERRGDLYRKAAGGSDVNSAQDYLDNQRMMYNAEMANRTGVPYEEYICQGNFQCIQQMYMNEQQAKAINNHADALRNQNVNVWGSVDMNHYYRY